MAWRLDPRDLPRNLQLGIVYGGPLAVVSALLGSAAFAQSPAMPSAPSAPTGLPTGLPSAPAAPSGMPTGAPTGLPSSSASPQVPTPPPPLPPPKPGGEAKPKAPAPPLPPPTDSDVLLWDVQPTVDEGPPGKVPIQLHPNAKAADPNAEDPAGLKADEIVVSPSNRPEASRTSLGWVIVLTAKDLKVRGYADLSQMLDDLPGMDVIRPYGDTYVRSYWRGYRSTGADPFLFMIDGVPFNQLFNGSTQILAAVPLSSIDHVEITFSPSSSVYGPNAAMGTINVITIDGHKRQEDGQYGPTFGAWVTFGGPQSNFSTFGDTTKIADATASYITKDFRIRISARLESSVLDTGIGSASFPYTQSSAYSNATAWGAGTLTNYSTAAGAFHSPDRKGAVDARVYLGRGTEIAAQYFTLSTGYGTVYPGDQRQNEGLTTSSEFSVYARHVAELSPNVKSTTLIQYRQSNIDSTTLTSNAGMVNLLATDAPASGETVQQAFDISTRRGLIWKSDQLGFNFGLRYRHLDLPGAAGGNTISSTSWAATDANPPTGGTMGSPQTVPPASFDEIGAWLLTKYAFNDNHAINLSARVDKTSERSDVNFSFRGGYAGTFFTDMLTFKIWYGHSIFEPSWAQELVAGTVQNPNATGFLGVDHLHTVEGDIDFRLPFLALHVDGFFTYATNPVIATNTAPSLINADNRELAGLDAGARFRMNPVNIWAYYTHTFLAQDSLTNVSNVVAASSLAGDGDIASDKIWAGLTFEYGPFAGTLLNRWVTDRNPVATNTTGASSWYTLLDANLMLSDLGAHGLWFAARVTNIIGTQVDQPGIQSASSGNTQVNSAGLYNSRLTQPGRGFFITAGFTFDPEKKIGGLH
jgi:outer membrane receptor for ferrienterochelin and colicins